MRLAVVIYAVSYCYLCFCQLLFTSMLPLLFVLVFSLSLSFLLLLIFCCYVLLLFMFFVFAVSIVVFVVIIVVAAAVFVVAAVVVIVVVFFSWFLCFQFVFITDDMVVAVTVAVALFCECCYFSCYRLKSFRHVFFCFRDIQGAKGEWKGRWADKTDEWRRSPLISVSPHPPKKNVVYHTFGILMAL